MNEPQGMFFEHFYDISKFWVKTLSYLFFFLGEPPNTLNYLLYSGV
jgi:hypothetical protein